MIFSSTIVKCSLCEKDVPALGMSKHFQFTEAARHIENGLSYKRNYAIIKNFCRDLLVHRKNKA